MSLGAASPPCAAVISRRRPKRRWLGVGDGLVLALGLITVISLARLSTGGADDKVRIRQAGRIYAEASLRLNRVIDVPGPLGITRVEIRQGRVRVLADPSPRQLCVRQGWLDPGEVALCLPNQVSVQRGAAAYDSLSY